MITTSVLLSENMSSKQLVEIGYDLQKRLHIKEGIAQKEKAVLEQKIMLLELQIKEGKERELNLKKMYDSMLTALNPSNESTSKLTKEIEMINEMHRKDLAELKQRHLETVISFKQQINDLKALNSKYEAELAEKDELQQNYKEKFEESEVKEKLMESRIKEMELNIKKKEEMATMKAEANEMQSNIALDKVRNEYKKEINKVKAKYEHTLKEIKSIYEKERVNTEAELRKANNTINAIETRKRGHNKSMMQCPSIDESNDASSVYRTCGNRLENHNSLEYGKFQSISIKPKESIEDDIEFNRQITNLKTYLNRMESREEVPSIKIQEQNSPSIDKTFNDNESNTNTKTNYDQIIE